MRVPTRSASLAAAVVLALACIVLAPPASAQYFGRNKVQYRTFNTRVLRTDHFDVYYYPEEHEAAHQAARMAERWYARLSRVLDHDLSGRQPLILYASHPDFEQTSAIEGELGEGTGGVTEMSKRRIVLPLAASPQETDHVIGHELVHAFQFDIARQGRSGASNLTGGGVNLPLWFVEGMAEFLSIGPEDPNTAMWMRDAAERNKLPKISQLTDPKYFPYRYGQALWAWIAGRWGDDAVARALKATNRASDAEAALASVTGYRSDSLSLMWRQDLRAWDARVAAVAQPAEHFGRVLETERHGLGKLNVSPALSPDGTRMVFLSERDLFSVEAYLADARTGHVLRRITRTVVDPHYESLEFIASSGAFSPDGRRFAFPAVTEGRPVLSIIDPENGRTLREIRFRDLGEVFNPSWSPDGRQIVFSAMIGGSTDLFIVDVRSGARRRLTNDLFADIEPSWSPDGRHIAFATDRFGTKFDDLEYGNMRLALMDPESGAITPVDGFADAKNVDPQWSPDGRTLFFVSDHGGISNIYRVPVEGGSPLQVTNLRTGVTGITPLGPALSVARDAGTMVYSAYVGGNYALYAADSSALVGTEPVTVKDAALLPPTEGRTHELTALQGNPHIGLQAADTLQDRSYRPRLSLDQVAQGGVGVSTGTTGAAIGGGTTLIWSDMLGRHTLASLLQVSNEGGSFANNLAAILAYQNRKSRWNWGFEGGQVPVLNRSIAVDEGTLSNGDLGLRQQDFRFWQIERYADASVQYPFSRVQRIELGAGFHHIGYQFETQTRIWDEVTGQLVQDQTVSVDSFPSLNLATASAALVYDSSIFGGTSPVLGQSYRLEVSPVVGDIHFTGVLGDYRRYVMLARPLSLAARVLHFGRYGPGSDDPRLGGIFVGYPWLIRGYDPGSFTDQELSQNGTADVFDRLIGSRIAVANVELRLPLLGALGLLRSPSIPPVEAAGFFDAGEAWTQNNEASFLGGDRRPVTSAGVAFRVNIFGIAIGEADLVHPNDRPLKGWYWQFNLQPGF